MYEGATSAVKLRNGVSKMFDVKASIYQGLVLSPLLFMIVMEALSMKFRAGLPFESLFADELILMADSKTSLLDKLSVWKEETEAKGIRVNISKTKVMKCEVRNVPIETSGK